MSEWELRHAGWSRFGGSPHRRFARYVDRYSFGAYLSEDDGPLRRRGQRVLENWWPSGGLETEPVHLRRIEAYQIVAKRCRCPEGRCANRVRDQGSCVQYLARSHRVEVMPCEGCDEEGTWHRDRVCLRCGEASQ